MQGVQKNAVTFMILSFEKVEYPLNFPAPGSHPRIRMDDSRNNNVHNRDHNNNEAMPGTFSYPTRSCHGC